MLTALKIYLQTTLGAGYLKLINGWRIEEAETKLVHYIVKGK